MDNHIILTYVYNHVLPFGNDLLELRGGIYECVQVCFCGPLYSIYTLYTSRFCANDHSIASAKWNPSQSVSVLLLLIYSDHMYLLHKYTCHQAFTL